jgi:hypothetical protein
MTPAIITKIMRLWFNYESVFIQIKTAPARIWLEEREQYDLTPESATKCLYGCACAGPAKVNLRLPSGPAPVLFFQFSAEFLGE